MGYDFDDFYEDNQTEFDRAWVDDAEFPHFDITSLSDETFGEWQRLSPTHVAANIERQREVERRGPRPSYRPQEHYDAMSPSELTQEMRARAGLRILDKEGRTGVGYNPPMFMREEDL